MKDVNELKQKRQKLNKLQRNMLDKIETEKRQFTADEDILFKNLSDQIDQLTDDILAMEVDIERRRKLAEKEISSRSGINFDRGRDVDPEREFRNIGEQFYAIFRMKTDGVRDPRLESLSEQRAQSMGVGAEGGFALPQQFSAEVREVLAQEAIVRPRATVIPAGEPPDAKLSFPALDQTSGSNIHGGVIITHTGEAITMTETSFGLREVSMEPKEMSAYIVVTNKLLVNWEAGGAFITKRLSSAMAAAEDYDFMRGDGINKALGLINSPCAISHTRAGVGAIAFADCYGMLAKVLMRSGSLVWVASQTTIPELSKMVDAGNHAVWLGSRADALAGAAGPLPSTLLGIPIIFSERQPALGSKGDLCLLNLSYYMIKDGSGPFVASSEHIYFLSNRTVFKIVWNVDAKPWLTEAIALEGSTSSTVSPFVILE